jgi:hypothetical protein
MQNRLLVVNFLNIANTLLYNVSENEDIRCLKPSSGIRRTWI